MPEPTEYYQSQPFTEHLTKLRDLEEKQRLLKERVLLLGQTHIEEREKVFNEIQELKKLVIQLKQENSRIKELIERITEQLSNTARKEELEILQRQFDLFRK